jgi:polar amino acid transport system substrate-binding protein
MPWRAHSRIVSLYAYDLAEKLGLPEHMMQMALLAGAVHDIGKRSVPEYILAKPSKLTRAERKIVEHHVLEGEAMLHYLAEIAKHHHERFDGTGYPDQLSGDEIPIISQIISVVDSYSAMTSDRPYRKAMSVRAAIEELRRCSGTHYDPRVVECFCETLENATEQYQHGTGGVFDNVLDRYPSG